MDRGLIGELRAASAGFWSERAVPKFVGVVMALVVGGYAAVIILAGGLYDKTQPQSARAVGDTVAEERAGKQDPADLAVRARRDALGVGAIPVKITRSMFEQVEKGVAHHLAIARREEAIPPGASADFLEFKNKELPKLGAKSLPSLPDVRPRSILFIPDEHCEIIGTSARRPAEVFDDYLGSLVKTKWLVMTAVYTNAESRGIITALSRGRIFILAVLPDKHFGGGGSTIHWEIQPDTGGGEEE